MPIFGLAGSEAESGTEGTYGWDYVHVLYSLWSGATFFSLIKMVLRVKTWQHTMLTSCKWRNGLIGWQISWLDTILGFVFHSFLEFWFNFILFPSVWNTLSNNTSQCVPTWSRKIEVCTVRTWMPVQFSSWKMQLLGTLQDMWDTWSWDR